MVRTLEVAAPRPNLEALKGMKDPAGQNRTGRDKLEIRQNG
jgi:hypothetical protein